MARQAARWTTAAKQDNNLLIAVLHANYGAGYLWALDDIANDQQIERVIKVNYQDFKKEIVQTQDVITKRLIMICPHYGPERNILTAIGGE